MSPLGKELKIPNVLVKQAIYLSSASIKEIHISQGATGNF